MKKAKKIISLLIPLVALAVMALPVYAGEMQPFSPTDTLPTEANTIWSTIGAITNWLFIILLIGAVIIIIIAAWTFLTAGGDTEKTKKARDYIIYALIAIVVAFLAKAVVVLIATNILGGTEGIKGYIQ